MKQDKLLIIFVKNSILGKTKTRLAAEIGDKKALEIYTQLLHHTASISSKARSDRQVHYSEYIVKKDMFDEKIFLKTIQCNGDLGLRMQNAFEHAFTLGYKKVIIIGSDCYELTAEQINLAFSGLQEHDVVIGPAKDGGYYLLGMNFMISKLFKNKSWSTNHVFRDTVADLKSLKIKYYELPELNDIDHLDDLPESLKKSFFQN